MKLELVFKVTALEGTVRHRGLCVEGAATEEKA